MDLPSGHMSKNSPAASPGPPPPSSPRQLDKCSQVPSSLPPHSLGAAFPPGKRVSPERGPPEPPLRVQRGAQGVHVNVTSPGSHTLTVGCGWWLHAGFGSPRGCLKASPCSCLRASGANVVPVVFKGKFVLFCTEGRDNYRNPVSLTPRPRPLLYQLQTLVLCNKITLCLGSIAFSEDPKRFASPVHQLRNF